MSLLRTTDTPSQVQDGRPVEDENRSIMGPGADVPRVSRSAHRPGPRHWRLWAQPRAAVVFLLVVELVAVVAAVLAGVWQPVTARSLGYFAVIVVLGIGAAEAARGVERMRRWFADTPHVNMSSVWTLSAALLLPASLVVATIVLLYGHMWLRSWRSVSGVSPFRTVFNIAAVTLCCLAAGSLARALPDFTLAPRYVINVACILLVVLVYAAVNTTLAAIALLLLRTGRSPSGLLGTWQENSLELATLCVGVLVAAVLAWRPLLVLLLLLPLYVLHRSVLIRQLEHAVTVDEKTELLNAATWRSLAVTELERSRRAGRTFGLLMVDLDHFAQVNERFGRAVGDQALRAVGAAMRREMRPTDLCGRLGGEEFAIVLVDTEIADAVRMADRMCRRVRTLRAAGADHQRLGLSVSIGVAVYPDAGSDLDEVLLAADNALFAAKDAGRDRVSVVQVGGDG